ncbi:50S ribosomal protein L6 [Patescibacteria group bacterium]|nr:50S ribosomal protein L6 [Patescibacteria group bacterium]
MSRIGKLPVSIPEGVEVIVQDGNVKVVGSKGTLGRKLSKNVFLEIKNGQVLVLTKGKSKQSKAMHGTTRALIANMVCGVSDGWSKTLELVGAGYRAEVSGSTLTLTVGYSHPVKIEALEGITFKTEKGEIVIEGIDREVVGQMAAVIRKVRPPEPYKGKGIKYKDEIIKRKPGKAAKAQGVA